MARDPMALTSISNLESVRGNKMVGSASCYFHGSDLLPLPHEAHYEGIHHHDEEPTRYLN
jgi:hypothetical protein